jgi:mannose-6-phosphate isomerase
MATSDNVVRAGLTPKFKDVDTLVNMLTYRTYTRDEIVIGGAPSDESPQSRLYTAPVPEFSILSTTISANSALKLATFNGPSVFIVVKGEGTLESDDNQHREALSMGSVFFVGASVAVSLQTALKDLVIFRAFCE